VFSVAIQTPSLFLAVGHIQAKDSSNLEVDNCHWVCQPWIKPESVAASGGEGSNTSLTVALSHWSILESNGEKVFTDFKGITLDFLISFDHHIEIFIS
jgi:hypothetical protein